MAYSADQPRDQRGRWTVGGDHSAGIHAATKGKSLVHGTAHEPEGYTRNSYSGEMAPHEGYAVGVGSAPAIHKGSWRDPKTGKLYTENSVIVKDRKTAMALARLRNEVAIRDLKRNKDIRLH